MSDNTIRLRTVPAGILLRVRATPSARHNAIGGLQAGALKVSVTAAPDKGKANRAITELLAKGLRLRKSQIELVSGETRRDKEFLIREIEQGELDRIIRQRVAGSGP